MVTTIAFMNLKGGVGKTTLAANIVRAIADVEKLKILLMDLDSQCNLTQIFSSAEDIDRQGERSVYQCFESKQFFKQPPSPSDLKISLYSNKLGSQIDIIYGSFETFQLAVSVPGGLKVNAAVQHFRDFMQKAQLEYDIIVLDTNPSGTFTTLCALDVSNFLVAPITFDKFSMRGVHLLTQVLRGRYPWLGNPRQLRLLPNRIPRSTDQKLLDRLEKEEQSIREYFPNLSSCIMANRIHESKLLANKQPELNFIVDRRVWPIHRAALAKVREDFEEAAKEVLISTREVMGNAAREHQTTLDVMRSQFEEKSEWPLVRH